MYCAIYDDEVIGYHEEETVIEEYCELLINSHPEYKDNLLIGKIKTKKIQKNQLEEMYLIDRGNIYVPSKYVIYYDIITDNYQEIMQAKESLQMMINTVSVLKNKEIKTINKTINIIEKYYGKEDNYVPTIEELKSIEEIYRTYLDN